MKMELKHIRNGIVSCVLGFAAVNAAYSDGYRNPPFTAEGIGKSGANRVFVDDASAVAYNPANLAFQTNGSVVVGLTFARQETEFESATTGVTADSDGDWNTLPNLFFSLPATDSGIAFGLGISTPFGQGISYDKEDLVNIPAFLGVFGDPEAPAIYDAEILMININPTVAFKLNEKIAIGVGADIFYSELEFKQFYPWSALGPTPFPPFEPLPNQNVEADGDGYGFGGNAAITWNITERQRMAFTYRSEVEIEYEGDLKASPQGIPDVTLINDDFDLDITYPTIIGAGYGIALTDSINVEANLEWLEWSVNDSLKADLGANGVLVVPQEWDDTFTFNVGGDWQLDENWVVRAGYAFIETPIPEETIAPSLPDADRHVLSVGLGYTVGGHTLDIAYAYSIYDDLDVDNNQLTSFNGDYDIDSDLFGLTYSYSF